MGYHYQGAIYLDAYNAACPDDERNTFYHVVSESEPPYEPAKRFMSEEFVAAGRMQYQRDLALYCQCLVNNVWPGYDCEAEAKIVLTGGWHITEPEPWMLQPSELYRLPIK